MHSKTAVLIDGAFGEGGGQILRTSAALSAITGTPVEIINIRAKRSKPGLQAQHLTSVWAAATLCNAKLKGAELGSLFLRFEPQEFSGQERFRFDVAEARNGASAGATGLVAQTILVPMSFLPGGTGAAEILGGTHVPMAPPADYLSGVYAPMLKRLGLDCRVELSRAGFFPKGGGQIEAAVQEGSLSVPIDLSWRGKLTALRLTIVTSQLPEHVWERGRDTLLKDLRGYGVPVKTEWRDLPGHGPGAAVILIAECENGRGGFTALGERGKPMERVATEALRDFQKWFASGAAVDEHLADQLALPCALIAASRTQQTPIAVASTKSCWTTPTITEHLRTVLHIIQQFVPFEYTLEEKPDGTGLVTVQEIDKEKKR